MVKVEKYMGANKRSSERADSSTPKRPRKAKEPTAEETAAKAATKKAADDKKAATKKKADERAVAKAVAKKEADDKRGAALRAQRVKADAKLAKIDEQLTRLPKVSLEVEGPTAPDPVADAA